MGKKKSIAFLTIISTIVAFLLVMTFVRFQVGIKNYNSVLGAIELGYDLKGGSSVTLTLSEDNEEEVKDIDEVVDTLSYRLDALGYSDYTVKPTLTSADSDYQIRIETSNDGDLQEDMKIVAAYGKVKIFGGNQKNPTEEILSDLKVIAGANYEGEVLDANKDVHYQVRIAFTSEGYDELIKLIDESKASGGSYYIELKLGETTILKGDEAITEATFNNKSLYVYPDSAAGARRTALQIGSGGLDYLYEISDYVDFNARYGKNVATVSAIIIGALALLIMAGLIVYYRGLGLIGALSMLLFILIETLMLIAVPGIVLSMGGVVGIIFATVMAGLMINYVCSRIKNEFETTQKTVQASIKKGFADALIPTICAGVIAGVVALFLLIFTTNILKGFAITFGIGVIISLISSLIFTRMYTSLLLPLAKNKEKFLNLNRVEE